MAEPLVGSATDLASFDAERFAPRILFENERMKVAVVALEPGQEIELHAPEVDVAIAVLEGTGELWAGDEARSVRAGDVAVIPAGALRGLRAPEGRFVALHVVTPPPTPEHHAVEHLPWPEPSRTAADPAAAIREEHRELLPHLDHLRELADAVGSLDEPDLRERLAAVRGFLTDVLLPHAEAEEEHLYPAIEPLLRAVGGATRTMSIDHEAIGGLIERLGALAGEVPSEAVRDELRRILVGLETLVRVHFDKEERIYVPLLERLRPTEAESLEQALQDAPGHGHAH